MRFSEEILDFKYAHTKPDGTKETWPEIAKRVAWSVMGQYEKPAIIAEVEEIIREKKFMPGGRYLYAAGRPNHQVTNCMLLDVEDSRESWAELLYKATSALMVGAGIGVVYSKLRPEGAPVHGLGGTSSGPLALMSMVNEVGRNVMQGGSRRSAIWAGLHWSHPDVYNFIQAKNWSAEVRRMKEVDFNFPAALDHTNISVILDDDFFRAWLDGGHPNHSLAQDVFDKALKRMCKTGEPGFSINVNNPEVLRNAPLSGNTFVLTSEGYRKIKDIVGQEVEVWTGQRWAKTEFKPTGIPEKIIRLYISGHRVIDSDLDHEFFVHRGGKITKVAAKDLVVGDEFVSMLPEGQPQPFDPYWYTIGFLYGDGYFGPYGAGLLLCTDSKKALLGYMLPPDKKTRTVKDYTRLYFKDIRGFSKKYFPKKIDNIPSFVAGLFDSNGSFDGKNLRLVLDFSLLVSARRLLEQLGIRSRVSLGGSSKRYTLRVDSGCVSDFARLIPTKRLQVTEYQAARHANLKLLDYELLDNDQPVYCCDVHYEEHSFLADGVLVSNCTEVTSADDSDSCNLGSINLARIETTTELERVVELAMIFMLCGTMYGLVPYPKVAEVREKNRRLGLGLMGLHEWLLRRGYTYDPNPELAEWLGIYAKSGYYADIHADKFGISRPIKTRAIAPAGTISIVAETTSGIEPIFCVAFKRRFLKGKQWNETYVVDASAERLIALGINPDAIEDVYSIGPERRIAMQHFVQQYVDQAIASTVNLPRWGSDQNNESTLPSMAKILVKYLAGLRGITFYPDGARGGQPIVPVSYHYAKEKLIEEFGNSQACVNGVCGI